MSEIQGPGPQEVAFSTQDMRELERLLQQDATPEGSTLTPAELQTWIQQSDQAGVFDQPVTLRTGDRSDQVTVEDAVTSKDSDGAKGVVRVKFASGQDEWLDAQDFLDRTGFDVDAFRRRQNEIRVEQQESERAAIVRSENDRYDKAREQLTAQEARNRRIFAPDQGGDIAKSVTDATHRQAEQNLSLVLSRDRDMAALVNTYGTAHPGRRMDVAGLVDAMHNDAELRLSVGSLLLGRINAMSPDQQPLRIRQNTEVNPKYLDQHGVHSREYAALLGIRMLDGSFDSADDNGIEANQRGEVELGQHRYTARLALGLPVQVVPYHASSS